MRIASFALCAGALLAALEIAGCSSSSSSNESAPTPPSTSSVIGKAGGRITGAGGVVVDVPPNALGADTTLTITTAPDAPAPAGAVVVGTPVLLGPEGQTFALPVKVTLPWEPAKLPSERTASDVAIHTSPRDSTTYDRLATTALDATHVAAETTHFSIFVPAVPVRGSVDGGTDAGRPVASAWVDVSAKPLPGLAPTRFSSIAFAGPSGGIIFAGAEAGVLWRSADQGNQWSAQKIEQETATIRSVWANETEVFVAPEAQYVYHATLVPQSAGLLTVERRPASGTGTPPKVPVTAMTRGPSGKLYACGGTNTLMTSADGGVVWDAVTPTGGVKLVSIGVRESTNHVLAVGENTSGAKGGYLYSQVDATYGQIVGSGGTGQDAFHAVWMGADAAWIVGDGGVIYRYVLGSSVNSKQAYRAGTTLRGIVGSGSTLIAVGDAGTIVRSTDAGNTWAPDPSGSTKNLHAVGVSPSGVAYAVGDDGTVLKRPTL